MGYLSFLLSSWVYHWRYHKCKRTCFICLLCLRMSILEILSLGMLICYLWIISKKWTYSVVHDAKHMSDRTWILIYLQIYHPFSSLFDSYSNWYQWSEVVSLLTILLSALLLHLRISLQKSHQIHLAWNPHCLTFKSHW